MDKKRLTTRINFLAVSITSFLLIFLGLKFIAGSLLSLQNGVLLLGFCVLLGAVSSLLYFLNQKIAYYIFNAGILVGIIDMYRNFFRNLNGWEDLTGLASLFAWILIGLCAGLTLQFIRYLYKKYSNRSVK